MDATPIIIGVLVAGIIGLARRFWPKLFKDKDDWAKAKRLLSSLLLAGVATIVVCQAAGDWTWAKFILEWFMIAASSQLTHNIAKRIPA